MNVVFTDYDTVIINDNEEITKKKYLTFLEKGIKAQKITDFNYNNELEEFTYVFNNRKYRISVSNMNNQNIEILSVLLELTHSLEIQEQSSSRKKEIINRAKKGSIPNEEARQLYLEHLSNKLHINKIFERLNLRYIIKDSYFSGMIFDSDTWVAIHASQFFVLNGISICTMICLENMTWLLWIILINTITSIASLITLSKDEVLLIKAITYFFKNLTSEISKISKENKLIRHKINSLKNYNISEEKSLFATEDNQNKFNEYLEKYLDKLYLKISKLNEYEKNKMRKKLQTNLEEYRNSVASIENSNRTNITIITGNFLTFLGEFERELDEMLKSNDLEINSKRITIDSPKKRILTLGGK